MDISLNRAFARMTARQSTICHRCRRAFASTRQHQQDRSATGALTDLLEASRSQDAASPRNKPFTRQPPSEPVSSSPSSLPGYDIASRALGEIGASQRRRQLESASTDLQRTYSRQDLENQQYRRWRAGDVYAPHDLSGIEASRWKQLRRRQKPARGQGDVLDQLGIDPIKEYKNFSIMAEYVSEMGRIKHSNETGLRPVNQRRMAKAIRRAIGIGLMPSVYRHPELLRLDIEKQRMWRG